MLEKMKCLRRLLGSEKESEQFPPVPEVKDSHKISSSLVYAIISNLETAGDKTKIYLVDRKYAVPHKKEKLKELLEWSKVNEQSYVLPSHDCNDYAFELLGHLSLWQSELTCGLMFGNKHAFNFFIYGEGGQEKVKLIEPQTDELLDPNDAGDHYKPIHFAMM